MASLFTPPYLDVGNGLSPSDGALLFFNVVGSETDKDTYTTAAAAVAHSNPVVADSKGVFPAIYLSGDYDWVLQNKNLVQQNTGSVSEFATATIAAYAKNFATLALAVANANLVDGDALNIAERTTGNGGGAMWDVVLSSTVTENTYNIVQCTGVGTLSLVLRLGSVIESKQWGLTGDGSTDDTAAFQDFCNYAMNNNSTISYAHFSAGTYVLSTTIDLTIATIAMIGEESDRKQSGSARSSVTFLWTGGSTPMMTHNKADSTFMGFNCENRGTATCWMDFTVGSQKHVFERLYFILATGATAFSTAVILSSGARLGYSQFKHIIATSPSSKFIYIQDGGSTGLTPITFNERCIFRATAGSFTIVDVENSTCEGLSFRDNTFIATSDEIVVVDTTTNPTTNPCLTIEVNNCEFDADTGTVIATDRFFKLTNVINFRLDGNQINAGGGGNSFATLVNTQVTSCQGNYFKSLDYVFDVDNDSIIRGVGSNGSNWSSLTGISNNPNCSFTAVPQETLLFLDGIEWGPAETAYFVATIEHANGTHDGAANASVLTDTTASWTVDELAGLTLQNTTDGSSTVVTSNTATTVTGTLSGGSDNDWDVSDAYAFPYTFALDTSKPQNWEPGQLFYITLRNTSGGTVAAPLFAGSTFNTQSTAFTAPANLKQITTGFRFNGTEAQQVTNEGPQVNN